jgi:hypothetical protein
MNEKGEVALRFEAKMLGSTFGRKNEGGSCRASTENISM